MFNFNRNSSKSFNVHHHTMINRSQLQSSLTNRYNSSLDNAKSFVNTILTRQQSINKLNAICEKRKSDKLKQIGNISNINNHSIQNKNMPMPREYKDISLVNKETKVVSNPAEIANILNIINEPIDKNNNLNSSLTPNNLVDTTDTVKDISITPNIINQDSLSNNNIHIDQSEPVIEFKYVISKEELIAKLQFIIEYIQQHIYLNTQYNFPKLIQFIYNMYEQYGNNQMSVMIIAKGLIQFNKKQMIKLPEDKITDIVTYIIDQIKK